MIKDFPSMYETLSLTLIPEKEGRNKEPYKAMVVDFKKKHT